MELQDVSPRTEDKGEAASAKAGEEVQRGKKRSAELHNLDQDDQLKPTAAKLFVIEEAPPKDAPSPSPGHDGTGATARETENRPTESEKEKAYTIVDQESQVEPALEKLRNPSAKAPFLAVDCEGEQLSRRGKLSIVSVGTESHTYLFDIKALGVGVFDKGLRDLLEDPNREKLMFDCRQDSDCLWHLFKVKLANVLDLQLLQIIYREDHPEQPMYRSRPRGFQPMLRGFRRCLDLYVHDAKLAQTKDAGFELMKADKGLIWMKRPLEEKLLEYAAVDVQGAFLLYQKLKQALDTPEATIRLRVGSQRYLDLFRSKDNRTHDKYELNAFLPWRVLPKSGYATSYSKEVTCTGCKGRFPGGSEDFLSYQVRTGVQKCPVCRKVEERHY